MRFISRGHYPSKGNCVWPLRFPLASIKPSSSSFKIDNYTVTGIHMATYVASSSYMTPLVTRGHSSYIMNSPYVPDYIAPTSIIILLCITTSHSVIGSKNMATYSTEAHVMNSADWLSDNYIAPASMLILHSFSLRDRNEIHSYVFH